MKGSLFNTFLLRIFAVLLLALSIMFMSNYYIYKSSMDTMYEQAEKKNELIADGIIQSFEESFKEIDHLIYTVGTLPYRVYDTNEENNINMNNAFLMLKGVNQFVIQNYIQDFVIFFEGSDLALTLNGTEDFQRVFSKRYKNNRYAPEFWKNFAVTSHPVQIIPEDYYTDLSSHPGETARLLGVVASNQTNKYGTNLVVFINLGDLLKKVNKQSMMEGSSIIILDKDKNVIVTTDGKKDLEAEILENLYFGAENKVTVQKDGYNYHFTKSNYNSFIYINKIPNRYDRAITTIRYNKIILVMTTIAGILISLALSIYIYRPLRKILYMVGMKEDKKNRNNYEYIYHSIEQMQLENKAINAKMDHAKQDVMRSIFFKMIDDVTFYKEMKDQIDMYFKAIFYNKQFLMVGFHLINNNVLDNTLDDYKNQIQKELEEIGGDKLSVVVFYIEDMQLVALIGVNDNRKRSDLLVDIGKVKDRLQETIFREYTVLTAVTKYYTEAQECTEAFDEIRMSFAYRSIKNTGTLIDLEECEYFYDIYMPLDFDEKLKNFIISGNEGGSLSLINEVIITNVNNNISYIKYKHVIDNIFNNLINLMVYFKIDKKEILQAEREIRSLKKDITNKTKIIDFFESLVKLILSNAQEQNQTKLDKELVLQYLQVHYREDLYLDKMAEIFNTTPKYFSNFFKKAFGINFVEYRNKIRVSHAKEMLKKTEIPVSEISEKVGYLNPSTFASTFKQYCGVTPSEYRKNMKS